MKGFLTYYYYGAIIYLGYQNYKRAHYFLKTVLETPGSVVSQIQIEAIKKYILVSLILKKELQIPSCLESFAIKIASEDCSPYINFDAEYKRATVEDIEHFQAKFELILQKDGNMGLFKQVVQAKTKANIQNLTLTFMTLSLEDVKSKCNFESDEATEKKIIEMVTAFLLSLFLLIFH